MATRANHLELGAGAFTGEKAWAAGAARLQSPHEKLHCRLRYRLYSLAGDRIPGLTRANRAEARCWESSLQRI